MAAKVNVMQPLPDPWKECERLRAMVAELEARGRGYDLRLQIDKCRPVAGDLLIIRVQDGCPLKDWQKAQLRAAVMSIVGEDSGVRVLVADARFDVTFTHETPVECVPSNEDATLTVRPFLSPEHKAAIVGQLRANIRGVGFSEAEDIGKMVSTLACSQCQSPNGVQMMRASLAGGYFESPLCYACFTKILADGGEPAVEKAIIAGVTTQRPDRNGDILDRPA